MSAPEHAVWSLCFGGLRGRRVLLVLVVAPPGLDVVADDARIDRPISGDTWIGRALTELLLPVAGDADVVVGSMYCGSCFAAVSVTRWP
jgi:hypothetical protein